MARARNKPQVKSFNTRFSLKLIKRIKLYCVKHDLTIRQFMTEAVETRLKN